MARPWNVVDRASTPDGELELRRRDPDDWLITHQGRVLMSSAASRSEEALGRLAAEATAGRRAPRVLIGGLGMGCTLRAALDSLPADARVVVAELNEVVIGWCRDVLAPVSGAALADPRVAIHRGDVARAIERAAAADAERFDAIALDLYAGPLRGGAARSDPHFGPEALRNTNEALRADGVFAVWAEGRDRSFSRRLDRAGFRVESHRPGKGGLRHEVTLARKLAGREAAAARRARRG